MNVCSVGGIAQGDRLKVVPVPLPSTSGESSMARVYKLVRAWHSIIIHCVCSCSVHLHFTQNISPHAGVEWESYIHL